MYFSWNLLFKAPPTKDTVNVVMMVLYPTFLYYRLFNLLLLLSNLAGCFPSEWSLSGILSVWISLGAFHLLAYLLILPCLLLYIFLTIGKPSPCFYESLCYLSCNLIVIQNIEYKQHSFPYPCILFRPVNLFKGCPGNGQTLYKMVVGTSQL
jgi:hypothetical protein